MKGMFRSLVLLAVAVTLCLPMAAAAQTGQPSVPELTVYTDFPSKVIRPDDSPAFYLSFRSGTVPQTVSLEMEDVPEGWTATFVGTSTIVKSVYVKPDEKTSLTLELKKPETVSGGIYKFVVLARSELATVRLPLELTVEERLPARFTFKADLPILRGRPTTTFRFNTTLENKGEQDVNVNLLTSTVDGFAVTIESLSKEVSSVPVDAGSTELLTVIAQPYKTVSAGTYVINVLAEGGGAQAVLKLVMDVTGEPLLTVTGPDGRLSANAYAGKPAPVKVVIQNNGTGDALSVALTYNGPEGWRVSFEPAGIAQIQAGQQVEIAANITPGERALTGDYSVTVNAQPEGGTAASAQFRITVLTSTMWGVAGVALIAVAVGVVGLAVLRFGRR
jgi:uncharacterized membrane protein